MKSNYKYKYRIITFRVDEDLERIILDIQEFTGDSISEIIRKALLIYNNILNVLQIETIFIKEPA